MNILNCHETSPHHSIENSSQLPLVSRITCVSKLFELFCPQDCFACRVEPQPGVYLIIHRTAALVRHYVSTPLDEFDFVVGVQRTYLSSFYEIVQDKFKPLFSMSPETIVATSRLLPKLLTFRSSDATMVFMTSVVITTHIANKHMNVKAPPN